jgi:anti-sigma regulatory factor (Ser/Thr protein kinase)
MRTGAATGHTGYFHEAILYDSDEHLLDVVVPFLLGGAEAGEPTFVGFGERSAALLRAELPDDCPVTFLPGGEVYARPAGAVRAYRTLLADEVAAGAEQIRIVGELPAEALGAVWDAWARYESAINHAFDDFPLWSMCAYDTRTTAPAVLADVARTHPRTARPLDRHEPSATYTDPDVFLLENHPAPADPLLLTPPLADLTDPSPYDAREAVRAADDGSLSALEVEDLVLSISEIVTNARLYGQAPVTLRLWRGSGRMVVTVGDAGPGPKDPMAGLMPVSGDAPGGLGLWIAHQSCAHVSLHRGAEGFTIRLTAGSLYTG